MKPANFTAIIVLLLALGIGSKQFYTVNSEHFQQFDREIAEPFIALMFHRGQEKCNIYAQDKDVLAVIYEWNGSDVCVFLALEGTYTKDVPVSYGVVRKDCRLLSNMTNQPIAPSSRLEMGKLYAYGGVPVTLTCGNLPIPEIRPPETPPVHLFPPQRGMDPNYAPPTPAPNRGIELRTAQRVILVIFRLNAGDFAFNKSIDQTSIDRKKRNRPILIFSRQSQASLYLL